MMKTETIPFPGYQGQAELYLQRQEPRSRKLVVILPGHHYYANRSPLELIGMMALSYGYEVLELRYSYQVSPYPTEAMSLDDLEREVDGILPYLDGYEEVCLVGKSLGTSLARLLVAKVGAPERSLILLTPLPDSVAGEPPVDRLCLIGDADPVFPRVAASREAHPAEWRIYPGVNHGLQVERDWRATAQVWQGIVAEAEAFFTRKAPRGCSPHWPNA
ncbi:MAG TPA: hypothetical protein VK191_15150 [Symbiobacteriaceae bacterium]|nr:hypothetical protein [Symbiobacteriaceae bacterium]